LIKFNYENVKSLFIITGFMMLIVVVPNELGIHKVKPEYIEFRQYLDNFITVLFLIAICLSLFLRLQNVRNNKGE